MGRKFGRREFLKRGAVASATGLRARNLHSAIASRFLLVESGRKDPIFPIAGSEKAMTNARRIFSTLGAADHIGYEIHEGAHEFHGIGAFEFLARRL